MPQFKIRVMMDKNHALVLSKSQADKEMHVLREELKRDKKYTKSLHCFHPSWWVEEHYVVTPPTYDHYCDAQALMNHELRKDGYKVL